MLKVVHNNINKKKKDYELMADLIEEHFQRISCKGLYEHNPAVRPGTRNEILELEGSAKSNSEVRKVLLRK